MPAKSISTFGAEKGCVQFGLRHSESGEEAAGCSGSQLLLWDLEDKHGREKKSVTLTLTFFVSCKTKSSDYSEEYRWRRYVATGECQGEKEMGEPNKIHNFLVENKKSVSGVRFGR